MRRLLFIGANDHHNFYWFCLSRNYDDICAEVKIIIAGTAFKQCLLQRPGCDTNLAHLSFPIAGNELTSGGEDAIC